MKYLRLTALLTVLLLPLVTAGCGQVENSTDGGKKLYVWYLNSEENGLLDQRYRGDASETEELVDEFLNLIRTPPAADDCKPVLADNVEILGTRLKKGILTLDFSKEYLQMKNTREVLARGGIVRTFDQIDGINGVRFSIEGKDAISPAGEIMGVMNDDTFVEDAGKKVNAAQHVSINLYFTGEDGTTLKREARSIYYTPSKPLEWAIVERIIAGPKVSGNYPTVPANTQIINVTSDKGVCYVNLNQTFFSNALNTDPEITIYSIVNSLIEDCRDIEEVKISVEGESNLIFKQSVDLSHPFKADFSLVETEPVEMT